MEMTARSGRARAKREQILAGARRVFLREGFAAATTDAIAAEAGISKQTLYAYYPGKDELFAGVLRTLTIENPQTRLLDFVRGAEPRSAGELREVLATLAEKVIATVMEPEHLTLLRTIIADCHRFPQLGDIFRATVPERGMEECRALLRRARENGVCVEGELDVVPRMFIGPLLSFVLIDGLFRPDGSPQPPDARQIEAIIDLFMTAIGNGHETEKGAEMSAGTGNRLVHQQSAADGAGRRPGHCCDNHAKGTSL